MSGGRPYGFVMPEGELTGRSVAPMGAPPPELWPSTLGEYLRDYIGRTVSVKYALPAGRWTLARGRLEAVGANFLAIKSRSLLLVELGSIIAVEVI